MKAVVLAGGWGSIFSHLGTHLEKIDLPIANKDLFQYQLSFLRKYNIGEVYICLSKENGHSHKTIHFQSNGIRVHPIVDAYPKGTAGCLKPLEKALGDAPFVVLNGNLLPDFDFDSMLNIHNESHAAITLAVSPLWSRKPYGMEVVVTDSNRSLKEYKTDLLKDSAYSNYTPHGVYIFSPEVLRLIPVHSYMDIKEQLIPDVNYQGGIVKAHPIDGYCKGIFTLADFYTLNRDVLEGRVPGVKLSREFLQLNNGVWVGDDVKIGAFVNLVGPVIIGQNSRIEKYTQVIGPTVIGPDCTVGKNSVVAGSIVMDQTTISSHVEIKRCIVSKGCMVSKNASYQNTVLVEKKMQIGDMNLLTPEYNFKDVLGLKFESLVNRGLWSTHAVFKRSFDLVVSTLLLVLLSPVLLMITVLLKMTSGSPVVFIQKRCGKFGKEFNMLKFRTMVNGADKMHGRLLAKNEVDGPMFKMHNDPRLTPLGRFLRNVSLDELPQLLNVIKGEMSLVGPRPLAINEMKYCNRWEDVRLKVKPGLTGLWQVNSRNAKTFHTWIDQDIYYIKHQSAWLDTKILFRTFRKFLSMTGT